MGLKKLEIDSNNSETEKVLSKSETGEDFIKVRAILSCPSCSYRKAFKNQFQPKNIENLVVNLKIFDWMTCSCGELLNLNLEFEI